jgi:hypothetical protein
VAREVTTCMHALWMRRSLLPCIISSVTSWCLDHVGLELESGILVALPLILKCHTHQSNKSKVVRHEGVWGSGCIDPRVLDFGTIWKSVVKVTPRPLYPPRKSPRHPLDRRLVGPQNLSGRLGEEKNLAPTVTRTLIPRSSSPSLVAIPTALCRLCSFSFEVTWLFTYNYIWQWMV